MSENIIITGRRREANARVYLVEGKGDITVNSRPFTDYFPRVTLQIMAKEPLKVCECLDKYDVKANVRGGGIAGQAGAIRHALARALVAKDAGLRPRLKKAGLLRRDPRMKERKKYGQKGARARFQWTKR